jgi:hypothetical protein
MPFNASTLFQQAVDNYKEMRTPRGAETHLGYREAFVSIVFDAISVEAFINELAETALEGIR